MAEALLATESKEHILTQGSPFSLHLLLAIIFNRILVGEVAAQAALLFMASILGSKYLKLCKSSMHLLIHSLTQSTILSCLYRCLNSCHICLPPFTSLLGGKATGTEADRTQIWNTARQAPSQRDEGCLQHSLGTGMIA